MEIDPPRLVAQLAAGVILADGRVTADEMDELGLLDELGLGTLSGLVEEEMRGAPQRPIDVRTTCRLLREQFPDAAPTILAALAAIAAADQDLSEAELEVLAEVGSDLGLAPPEAERILDAVFRIVEPETTAPAPPQPAAHPPLDPRLGRALLVLGLDTLTGRADLDLSYRRLIERYDPAKVIELGPDFAAVAVRKLAEVTDAYRLAVEALQSQD